MPTLPRVILALVVALTVGFGLRYFSEGQGFDWAVPPEQVAAADAAGRPGTAALPGIVTVLPIRRETGSLDRFLWAGIGLGAGLLMLAATRKRGSR